MKDDYIRKEDAVEALDGKVIVTGHENADAVPQYMKDISNKIKSLEPADVVPVVHSRWEYKCGEIRCPECGNRIHRIDLSGCLNFCPNCGTKMDREE